MYNPRPITSMNSPPSPPLISPPCAIIITFATTPTPLPMGTPPNMAPWTTSCHHRHTQMLNFLEKAKSSLNHLAPELRPHHSRDKHPNHRCNLCSASPGPSGGHHPRDHSCGPSHTPRHRDSSQSHSPKHPSTSAPTNGPKASPANQCAPIAWGSFHMMCKTATKMSSGTAPPPVAITMLKAASST